ncbi:Prophage CP4-57 regulatory protein (AlpA) [compost metagenome]
MAVPNSNKLQRDQRAVAITNDAFISEETVLLVIGLSQGMFRKLLEEGKFPRPVPLGEVRQSGVLSRVAWLKSEVEEWIRTMAKRRVDYSVKPHRIIEVETTVQGA